MLKRIYISSMVLAILLQNSIASCAIAHGSDFEYPHIHVGTHGHSHDHHGHSHHHGHHGHSHHHGHNGHSHAPFGDDEKGSQPDPANDLVRIVDFDAIVPAPALAHVHTQSLSLDYVVAACGSCNDPSPKVLTFQYDRPPPRLIYLQICALLI